MFITVFTPARHFFLTSNRSIQSTLSQLITFNIILPSVPRSSMWCPSLRFPHQHLYVPLFSHIRATCPAYLLLHLVTRIFDEKYKTWSSSQRNFLKFPVNSCILGPNSFLSTLFSNIHSLRSTLILTDQASHPHRTSQNIVRHLYLEDGGSRSIRNIGTHTHDVTSERSQIWRNWVFLLS